jgi:hypothetical protein
MAIFLLKSVRVLDNIHDSCAAIGQFYNMSLGRDLTPRGERRGEQDGLFTRATSLSRNSVLTVRH